MRYAIVSDIHANWQAWSAVRNDLLAQKVDMVICLGDVVGYGPNPAHVLSDLRLYCDNFVLGNHDAAAVGWVDLEIFSPAARRSVEWTATQLDEVAKNFIRQFPIMLEDERAVYVHAEMVAPEEWGYVDDLEDARKCFDVATKQVTFIGHTHRPTIFILKSGYEVVQDHRSTLALVPGARYIINVGSVGDPRDATDQASYCIYDRAVNRVELRKVTFDCAAYARELQHHPQLRKPTFLMHPGHERMREARERAMKVQAVATMQAHPTTSRAEIHIVERPVAHAEPVEASVPVASAQPVMRAQPVAVEQPVARVRRDRKLWFIGLPLLLLLIASIVFFAPRVYRQWKAKTTAPPPVVAPPSPASLKPETFVLKPAEENLMNKREMRIETKYDNLPNVGYWYSQDEYVSWTVTVNGGGKYKVELAYSLEEMSDGSTFVIMCGPSRLDGQLKTTGDWAKFQTVELGTLRLPAGQATIEVRATGRPKKSVMNLRSLTFRPVTN